MYHLIRNEVKLLLDPDTRAFYKSRGWTLERWLEQWVGLEKAAMEGFDDVAFSLHVCRGNQYSRWLVSGGLRDPGKASIFPRPVPRDCGWSTKTPGRAPLSPWDRSRRKRP